MRNHRAANSQSEERAKPVTPQAKRQIRSAEYRDLAAQATSLAQASPLPHVRQKHELSAAKWTDLAELDERESTIPPVKQENDHG